jgi:hypothetical protein
MFLGPHIKFLAEPLGALPSTPFVDGFLEFSFDGLDDLYGRLQLSPEDSDLFSASIHSNHMAALIPSQPVIIWFSSPLASAYGSPKLSLVDTSFYCLSLTFSWTAFITFNWSI